MSNSLNPVFGEWYTDRQIGAGTDGKVFSIYRERYDGTRENSILKIIRLGENRNERKVFNLNEEEAVDEADSDEDYEAIINQIKKSVRTLMKTDAGKNFVKYEDLELRKASDGKGRLILIRLEEAKSLTDILKDFSLTLEESIRLGINVCNSLIKCREFDYFYPNLKPENILFDRDGRCKLGDLGTFGCLEPAKTSVAFKRTQYFMAPEFIKTGNINCTVDTYSLGLILYMLTNRNRLPFTPEYPEPLTVNSLNSATSVRLTGAPLPRPALANDGLWKVISKACSYKINERYLTPNQMLADLKNVLENKPLEAAVYDEVYSVAPVDPESEAEETVIVPEIENVEQKAEKITPVLSLKEEITIPTYSPKYKNQKPQAKKKKVYAKLPEIKNPKKRQPAEIRRMIAFSIAAIVLFILLVISLALRASAEGFENMLMVISYNDVLSFNTGGALIWQPI